MTADAVSASVRIARHWDGSAIQPEAALRRDLMTWTRNLEVATGLRLNIDVARILESARLIAGPS